MLAVAEQAPIREHLPVAAARAGEPAAWDALFRRYQLPLYAYARELLADDATALDVVQEAFVSAVRHLGSLREDDRFGAWLFGIAHQKCVQQWRRRARVARVLDEETALPEDAPAADPDPSEWLVQQEDREAFFSALGRLPEAQRAVLLLHFLEDFPLADIARITAVPLGTVKSRLHHAKLALRRLLEPTMP